jgi:superfamily II DNA or RNA helicase
MPKRTSHATGSELFIVDNSDEEWKALRYLRDWCQLSKGIDIATAYFEIGSLLALDGEWQKVDKIRILMGDEVSKRTKKAFDQGLASIKSRLEDSLEAEKDKDDFLTGVPAIVEAIKKKKIECRVYRKDKFHAKAYITHARMDVVGSAGLVGSSNFTSPGLTKNIELNVQITGSPVNVLQDWYEEHWGEAEDITPEILKVVERHVVEYSPFDIYAKALQEFFKSHEQTASEWEKNNSKMYPVLAKYQQEGYHSLVKKASKHNGAFLCDGVGLGKTFIGLMLIERLLQERKNVALFVPKAARNEVWEAKLKRFLPEASKGYSTLKIFNHTDLMREGLQEELEQVRRQADAIIIDEAHHFRNTGTKGTAGEPGSRYWRMYDIAENKQVFMLTATPINNKMLDFQHMIELFTRGEPEYFNDAPLGIHSLAGHIRKLENALEKSTYGRTLEANEATETNLLEAEDVLSKDALFKELVVQRSRKYVKQSMILEGGDSNVMFPAPREPEVADYSIKQTYGKLLGMLADAFNKRDPLFSLAIYYPYAFYKGDDKPNDLALEKGRRHQVVSLIRTQFLKRFESSVEAFRNSCWNLLYKLLAWLEVHAETEHEKGLIERWKRQNAKLIGYVAQRDLLSVDDAEEHEDIFPPELLDTVEKLDKKNFNLSEIISETLLDLDQLADFLRELEQFKPSQDKKLKALLKLLKTDPVLSKHKVLIFTEFKDTAHYLEEQLKAEGIDGVAEIDSSYKGNRGDLIRRFAPYYNESSSSQLKKEGMEEIRVLISTDVLSEGLNLQDATRLINYDLHWNPVRLMQRIGRVDRRMDPEIEKRILKDHPNQKDIRGTVAYWNFLPPDELDSLLSLYKKVTHKTLRISKTLGIEGRKLLTKDDDYEDLKNFTETYEGKLTPVEEMHLEYQQLLQENPALEEHLNNLPLRVFSGKEALKADSRAVFFCYARPAHDAIKTAELEEDTWTVEAGDTHWYLYDIATDKIIEEPTQIAEHIRSTPKTKRATVLELSTLSEIRNKVDKHIKNTYLKQMQAPMSVKPVLKCWMELV